MSSKRFSFKKTLSYLIKAGITVLIFYYLIQQGRINLSQLRVFFDRPIILFSFFGVLGGVVLPLTALRWWLLLKGVGIQLELRMAFWLTWIGNFFNSTLPGAVSGDLVKGYYLHKSEKEGKKTPLVTSLLVDRLTGLFGLIILASAALLLNLNAVISKPLLHPLAISILIMLVGVIAAYLLISIPIKEEKDPFLRLFNALPGSALTVKIYSSLISYRNHRGLVYFSLFITLIIHSSILLLMIWIASFLTSPVPHWLEQAMLIPIGLITTAIPIAPGGIGIGHAALDGLYLLSGSHGGADVFNLFIIIQLIVNLFGSLPYFFFKVEVDPEQDIENDDEMVASKE